MITGKGDFPTKLIIHPLPVFHWMFELVAVEIALPMMCLYDHVSSFLSPCASTQTEEKTSHLIIDFVYYTYMKNK